MKLFDLHQNLQTQLIVIDPEDVREQSEVH